MGSKISILHLEDNIDDAELIEHILTSNKLDPLIKRVDNKVDFTNSTIVFESKPDAGTAFKIYLSEIKLIRNIHSLSNSLN